ncbi:MAG: hypothetical protein P8X95_28655 [Anaerolineales bacterium]
MAVAGYPTQLGIRENYSSFTAALQIPLERVNQSLPGPAAIGEASDLPDHEVQLQGG